MNIVWLASYPKSGNTWLRFFLYNYLFGPIRNSEQVAERIPDIHRVTQVSGAPGETLYCKTHFLCSEKHPQIGDTSKFIYLLRHPKDILLSSLNYYRLGGGMCLTDESLIREFLEQMGAREWCNLGYGCWPEHIESWLNCPVAPHLVVRYEYMLSAPSKTFSKVVEFLGLELDEGRVNQAIKDSSFSSMRRLENKEREEGVESVVFSGGDAKPDDNNYRFMNKGKAGLSLNEISADLDTKFNERFGFFLEKLGYNPD